MAIFYAVVEGDPLSSKGNGRVLEGALDVKIQGQDGRHRMQTFLGHKAWCDECKSVGVIAAAGGLSVQRRMYDKNLDAREAVGGDWVLCNCEKHPKVISLYGRSVVIVDEPISHASFEVSTVSKRDNRENDCCFDERVVATNGTDGGPIFDYPYCVETSDGNVYEGRTDKHGYLPRIATRDVEDCCVYWGDEALARQSRV